VSAIHIRVGHDDNAVIAEIGWIKIFALNAQA
jgi:hypothetical protein